jgi:hypothetical protein
MMTQAPLRPLLVASFFGRNLLRHYVHNKVYLCLQKEAIEETIKVAKQEVARAKLNKSRILCSSGRTPLAKNGFTCRLGISWNESIRRQATFPYFVRFGLARRKASVILTTRPEESNIWVRTAIVFCAVPCCYRLPW